jgi:alcohol dehydrogenase
MPIAQQSTVSPSTTSVGPATSVGPPHGHRPHGWLRHYGALLGPSAPVATKLAFERNNRQRWDRLVSAAAARRGATDGTRRMRALLAAPGGRLRWQNAPVPSLPGPDAAIVHPIAASTCDLDCSLALGATPLLLPLHLGHECVAEVLEVGERVTGVRPGQRVIVPFQVNCGECRACASGFTGNCTSVPPLSMYGFGLLAGHWGGAFSDQLAVPYADAMLVPLPDGVEPAAACGLADNVCDAYRHVAPHLPALLERDPDAEVLIAAVADRKSLFSGSVQLYTGLIARALGARRVVLADARPHIRAEAERLGIEAIAPDALAKRPPAPLVIDMSIDALGRSLACTAADGVCSSSGTLHRSARIPTLLMYGRNATLHFGRTHARALIPRVLELLTDAELRPLDVSTRVAPLDQAPTVLAEHFRGGVIKTVLTE